MYEYGTRLTIRQLTAHLAYLLTAGMEYTDIRHLAEREDKPLMSEFLFYNRFFGDDGHTEDQAAVRMPVIHEVRAQGFGERPCPATERHLWLLTHGDDFSLGVPLLEEEFRKLRRYGSQMQIQENGLTPDQAREQVRRMLYFLHENKDADRGNAFLRQFLGSLALSNGNTGKILLRVYPWMKQVTLSSVCFMSCKNSLPVCVCPKWVAPDNKAIFILRSAVTSRISDKALK